MVVEQKIAELLTAKFEEEAFQDCFLVEVKLRPGNKLEVFIDNDNGVTHQLCQQISRLLEEVLDNEGWLGDRYTLEVSSPGLDAPLRLKRQYFKNVGRNVRVELTNGTSHQGLLCEVTENYILLSQQTTAKKGKQKVEQTRETLIPFDQIRKTTVLIQF